MLQALTDAVRERDEATSWGIAEQQGAQSLELLQVIYRVLHAAHMKPPHPEPWDVWRPDHVKAAALKEAAKPLSPRQFLGRLFGRG